MSLALIIATPFIGALFPGLMIRAGRNVCALLTGGFSAFSLLLLYLNLPAILRGEVIENKFQWIPVLGLDAHFFLDGLGFLFATLILGIGLLIVIYARFYLVKTDPMGQFYSYLLLFQGAMLGIVLSDNILILVIFWELTSLSSFLLIGYWRHLSEARQGARMALAVTGAGGLAMIAGMLLLGNITGSYDLSEILTQKELIQESPLYLPALILILLGCFTKSAQFPFHFWLPRAMAAPTPVSAYLHSATMVKAGIFLMARMWPVLAGTPEWFFIVTTTGLVTMMVGAKIALFQNDLKALLAYSTVAHLGLITMLLGFGTTSAAIVAVFHIINHATFKASLFMSAGIVDHETHTRDLRRLGGLRHLMPITFVITTIAALSMAGFPPLNGFLSKEMMFEEVAHTRWFGSPVILSTLAVIGALFSVAYSLRLISHGFLGAPRNDYPHPPHDPPVGLWIAPAFLVALVIIIGIIPQASVGWLVTIASQAVTHSIIDVHIVHWHGWGSPALWMSVISIISGYLLLKNYDILARIWERTPKPDAKVIFDGFIRVLVNTSETISERLHNGSLTRYIAIGVTSMIAAGFYAFKTGTYLEQEYTLTPISIVPFIGWATLILAITMVLIKHHNRLISLILISIVGLMVSVGFAYFSAPDLALTQISADVVTTILMLLSLNFLPKKTPKEIPKIRSLRNAFIAAGAGVGIATLSYMLMISDPTFPSIADFHIANSKPEAGGTNIVNVILVDFRGYDTFGEVTVLGIAGLLIFSLVQTLLSPGPANDRLLSWPISKNRAGDRHPLMMVVFTRLVLPIALMVGVFIFLRGHNLPGGGFVAGLIVSIAFIMQYIASGFAWAHLRQKADYQAFIAAGILITIATGVGAWFNDMAFLTSDFTYVNPPIVEKFELATAAFFDLGVFLAVFGAVMLSLASLSRIARRAGEEVNIEAFDIDLPVHDEPASAANKSKRKSFLSLKSTGDKI